MNQVSAVSAVSAVTCFYRLEGRSLFVDVLRDTGAV
jgi:hypothetical protein